jgi:hypothetical protein
MWHPRSAKKGVGAIPRIFMLLKAASWRARGFVLLILYYLGPENALGALTIDSTRKFFNCSVGRPRMVERCIRSQDRHTG